MNDLLKLILTLAKTYLMYPPNLENKQLHVWKYRKRRFPSKRTSWCRRGEGVIRQRPEPAWAGRAEIQRSLSADLREPAERIAIFKMAAWYRGPVRSPTGLSYRRIDTGSGLRPKHNTLSRLLPTLSRELWHYFRWWTLENKWPQRKPL